MIPLKTLIKFCRKLPHATEDVKWEKDLVFSVGGKMFAVFDEEEMLKFSFKVPSEEFNRLTKVAGVVPAPYLARAHWIAVSPEAKLPTALLKELLEGSRKLVYEKLPKTVQKKMSGKK